MRSTRRQEASRRGFTLAELLVAMAITGLVSLAIFAMMSQTSDSMQMAESSASTLDSARFAVDQVKGMVMNAGSYGTVDSFDDPRVRPRPHHVNKGGDTSTPEHIEGEAVSNSSCNNISGDETLVPIRVAGLVTYGTENQTPKWQDYGESVMSDDDIRDANSESEFDGIIVMGAYDYPVPFEVTNVQVTSNNDPSSGAITEATVPATPRGTYRLADPDPFETEVPTGSVSLGNLSSDPLTKSNEDPVRVLRVMDHSGHYQFSRLASSDLDSTTNELSLGLRRLLHFKSDGEDRIGLEKCSQQSSDITYQASLLDAYWLHVREDPNDPSNFQLVRERLDANELVTALTDTGGGSDDSEKKWADLDPTSTPLNYDEANDNEPIVLADRVVDFQLWFDCAQDDSDDDGVVAEKKWHSGWEPPSWNTSDDYRNCMNPNNDPDPGRARIAHVRLSMRTAHERRDLEHFPFPSDAVQMQTFDIEPNAQGAARVMTIQQDFELSNFSMRNIMETHDADSS